MARVRPSAQRSAGTQPLPGESAHDGTGSGRLYPRGSRFPTSCCGEPPFRGQLAGRFRHAFPPPRVDTGRRVGHGARPVSASTRTRVERYVASPYARFVGVELDAIEPGRVRLRLPHREDTMNRAGSLHGGVTASLLDVAGVAAAHSVAGHGIDAGVSTIDLAVHYLASAGREAVVMDGIVTRRGREIVFVEATVATSSGTPIARSTGVVRVVGASTAEPSLNASPCPVDATTPLTLHGS